ncbi:hypothetical protein M0812_23614 [Anaeramoeba flamelloides]|uniref:N-acetyltransferase domain-containing protein n=1 Tax=Anaeramoeba flamelloides TaxID=1746091 RepID=A0AAV7YLF5_9EUKA|nr:hypothetical protein M0812_23614 [Anaeramoeba flamelloides]
MTNKNILSTHETNNGKYDLKMFTIEYLTQATEMVFDAFITAPLYCEMVDDNEAFKLYLKSDFQKTINQEVGVIALDRETKELVGVVSTFDNQDTEEEKKIFEQASKKMQWEVTIFHKLMDNYFQENNFQRGQNMYISWLAVNSKYRRRGLATALFKEAIGIALKKGYERCCVWLTNRYSQRICKNLNFTIIKEMEYSDLSVDGLNYFTGMVEKHNVSSCNCSEMIF